MQQFSVLVLTTKEFKFQNFLLSGTCWQYIKSGEETSL